MLGITNKMALIAVWFQVDLVV